jgi:uncharacterized membrane protein YidH (DUF202 family)
MGYFIFWVLVVLGIIIGIRGANKWVNQSKISEKEKKKRIKIIWWVIIILFLIFLVWAFCYNYYLNHPCQVFPDSCYY